MTVERAVGMTIKGGGIGSTVGIPAYAGMTVGRRV